MKYYTAVVEVSKRGNMSGDEVDTIMERLAGHSVSLSVSPRGYRSARISVPADNLAQAASGAVLAVTHGYGLSVDGAVSLEVMSETEADLRDGSADVPDLVGVTEAAQLLHVTPQRVRQMIDEGKLAAHRIGERSFALVRSEVLAKASPAVMDEWTSVLEEVGVAPEDVLEEPKRDAAVVDGRVVARYRFRAAGSYPTGKRVMSMSSDSEVTEFDITRPSPD